MSLGDVLGDPSLHLDSEITLRKILSDLSEGRADVRPLVKDLLRYRTVVLFIHPSWVARAIEQGADAKGIILTQAYFYLGYTLSHLGRYSEAVDCLRHALNAPNQDRFVRAYLLATLARISLQTASTRRPFKCIANRWNWSQMHSRHSKT